MLVKDITKFTLQDYPNNTACIIWFTGCNLNCKYCHNADLVINKNNDFLTEEYVLKFLESRVGLLDGVVLSGGECTLSNNFVAFVKKIKGLGFKIKVDTNGINYNTIFNLIENNIIDYVALDFKSMEDKFELITEKSFFNEFKKTLLYLIDKSNKNIIDLEIRTTVHTDLLNENDINNIINFLDNLNYKSTYYIQNFINNDNKILGKLDEQKYIINKNNIIIPKNFNVEFRNF